MGTLKQRNRSPVRPKLFVFGATWGGFVGLEVAHILREVYSYNIAGFFPTTIDPPNRRSKMNFFTRNILQRAFQIGHGKRLGIEYKAGWGTKDGEDALWYYLSLMDQYSCPIARRRRKHLSDYNHDQQEQGKQDAFVSKIKVKTKTTTRHYNNEKILGEIPLITILAENDTISDNNKASGWCAYSDGVFEIHTVRNAPHLLLLQTQYIEKVTEIVNSHVQALSR